MNKQNAILSLMVMDIKPFSLRATVVIVIFVLVVTVLYIGHYLLFKSIKTKTKTFFYYTMPYGTTLAVPYGTTLAVMDITSTTTITIFPATTPL